MSDRIVEIGLKLCGESNLTVEEFDNLFYGKVKDFITEYIDLNGFDIGFHKQQTSSLENLISPSSILPSRIVFRVESESGVTTTHTLSGRLLYYDPDEWEFNGWVYKKKDRYYMKLQ